MYARYIPRNQVITTAQLIEDTQFLTSQLSYENFSAVLGVGRSGMLPATYIAGLLSLPLGLINIPEKKIEICRGGKRFSSNLLKNDFAPVLIVDDTVCTGIGLKMAQYIVNKFVPDVATQIATVYCDEAFLSDINFTAAIYNRPHFLEWCLYNTFFMNTCLIHIDNTIYDTRNRHFVQFPRKYRVLAMYTETFQDEELLRRILDANRILYNYLKIGENESHFFDLVDRLKYMLRFVVVYSKELAEKLDSKYHKDLAIICWETKTVLGEFYADTNIFRLAYPGGWQDLEART